MIISLIAAMDRNRLIGCNNQLPWHLPADFAWFKAVTLDKPVVMGRRTWESIGKPLPGRHNIVLSRNPDLDIAGATCVADLDAAIAVEPAAPELMIIGGSSIYQLALPRARRLYLTHVDGEFAGDAWFPETGDGWRKVESTMRPPDERNAYACEFAVYEKM